MKVFLFLYWKRIDRCKKMFRIHRKTMVDHKCSWFHIFSNVIGQLFDVTTGWLVHLTRLKLGICNFISIHIVFDNILYVGKVSANLTFCVNT